MQQSMIPGNFGISFTRNQQIQEKQLMGIFSVGTGKVQTCRMSRLHNDDVMNVNGRLSVD